MPSRSYAVLKTIEATASVFFAFVVGLVVIGLGLAATMGKLDGGSTRLIVAGACVALAEVVVLGWLKGALEACQGIPYLALQQPRWPLLLRPVVAAWWLSHLAPVVGVFLFLENMSKELVREGRFPPLGFVWIVFGLFTVSHTSHLYALLTLTSIYRSPRVVQVYWRWRFAIDVILTLIGMSGLIHFP